MSIVIKLNTLSFGENQIEFPFKLAEAGLQEPFIGEGFARFTFDKTHHQLLMRCELFTEIETSCDRCGKQLLRKLQNDFDFVYLFETPEEEDDSLNLRYLAPETDKVDITQEIFDYANLSIPLRILCDEDCKGLCPHCGSNLNLNLCNCSETREGSLYEKLQDIKKKLENK
ncbi:MAG: DUF177 domain-containing protein [Ignavibacteriaceae bacterium]|nr:DUF177 domain-containing protein [Ignavibacteriaceae bacterium]